MSPLGAADQEAGKLPRDGIGALDVIVRHGLGHSVDGDQFDEAGAHEGAAQSYLALGDLDNARAHWQTVLDLHTKLGTTHVERLTTVLENLDPAGS